MTETHAIGPAVPDSRLLRFTSFLFGGVVYLTLLFTILYAIGFVSGLVVPKAIDNLLVPCRAFSATHEGAAAARVMATMTAVGQAAGLAAADAARRHITAAEVPAGEIRMQVGYLDSPPVNYP